MSSSKDIERLINDSILANIEMRTDVMSIDDALKLGNGAFRREVWR